MRVWKRRYASTPPIVLMMRNVEMVTESGCWIYMKALSQAGYAHPTVRRGARELQVLGHRLMYEHVKGEIPAGFELDHKCRVRCCVNPDHLEPVPQIVNILRGQGPSAINARKTVCPKHGTPYHQGKHCRVCRTCQVEAQRRYLARKRVEGER